VNGLLQRKHTQFLTKAKTRGLLPITRKKRAQKCRQGSLAAGWLSATTLLAGVDPTGFTSLTAEHFQGQELEWVGTTGLPDASAQGTRMFGGGFNFVDWCFDQRVGFRQVANSV
jgi:hypothetical protein